MKPGSKLHFYLSGSASDNFWASFPPASFTCASPGDEEMKSTTFMSTSPPVLRHNGHSRSVGLKKARNLASGREIRLEAPEPRQASNGGVDGSRQFPSGEIYSSMRPEPDKHRNAAIGE